MQLAKDHHHDQKIFTIDQPAAIAACAAARQAMQAVDYQAAQDHLIDAIRLRPSCALAYKLLGDVFRACNNNESAGNCARNLLPDTTLSQYFPEQRGVINKATEYTRTGVVASAETGIGAPHSLDDNLPFKSQTLKSSPCFVDRLVSASLWHDDANTVVFDKQGAVLEQHSVGSVAMLQSLCAAHEPMRVSGRAILLGAKGAHNFYHWKTDIIPKIILLIESGVQICSSDTFIVSRATAGYARQLLAVFDIRHEQIIETEFSSPYICADELLVPYLQNKMGYTMGRWLPARLKSAMAVQNIPAGDLKLFVNRNPATAAGRTLVNHCEVEAWFVAKGFTVVFPETLSVIEQAQLFASAKVVAGVHGAGLSNLVYCRRQTKVIEFYGVHIAPCYWIISALSGLDYYQLRCAGAGLQSGETNSNRHSAGFELPLSQAQALLEFANAL